jgi:mannose-1-phosphate guanylyltransferase/mannose-6-phosphate isomerase
MVEAASPRIHPVLLSGGVGARLWPMSRAGHPKQLLSLVGGRSMIEETALRARGVLYASPIVVCNQAHRFAVADLLGRSGIDDASIVLEPEGRNTAPAVAAAALVVCERDPDGLMLVLPSDHVVRDVEALRDAVVTAAPSAADGRLVTFGIKPDRPETSYGYIHAGEPLPGLVGVRTVDLFVEKPDLATAADYLAAGTYFWNSGMFLFRARTCLAEIERFEPSILEACRGALAGARRDLDFLRLEATAFKSSPSISIDYAVMERTDRAAVVPVDMGWSDVGAWNALWEISDKDRNGNVLVGDVLAEDVNDSYLRVESGPMVAAVGIDNAVVVATEDAVLVTTRATAQDVKLVVNSLRDSGRAEHAAHAKIYRPWGSYRKVATAEHFQVRHIDVKPGGVMSLHLHHHRREHWVVLEGTARVTCGETSVLLRQDESISNSEGSAHRLENPGKVPLRLIEVQTGSYLGEDDIVRLEDPYGAG